MTDIIVCGKCKKEYPVETEGQRDLVKLSSDPQTPTQMFCDCGNVGTIKDGQWKLEKR